LRGGGRDAEFARLARFWHTQHTNQDGNFWWRLLVQMPERLFAQGVRPVLPTAL